jgi:hypothetical protein
MGCPVLSRPSQTSVASIASLIADDKGPSNWNYDCGTCIGY